jgi:hypothetical protein
MVVGIITGTYSTVFIAAAIVSFWRGKHDARGRPLPPESTSDAGCRKQPHAETEPQKKGSSFVSLKYQSAEKSASRLQLRASAFESFLHAHVLKAAILGVIQGLTEFLPVSSTAHLLITGRLIGYDDPAASSRR